MVKQTWLDPPISQPNCGLDTVEKENRNHSLRREKVKLADRTGSALALDAASYFTEFTVLAYVGPLGNDLVGADISSAIQHIFEQIGDREGFAGHQFQNSRRDHIEAGVHAPFEHRLFLNANDRVVSDVQAAERYLM